MSGGSRSPSTNDGELQIWVYWKLIGHGSYDYVQCLKSSRPVESPQTLVHFEGPTSESRGPWKEKPEPKKEAKRVTLFWKRIWKPKTFFFVIRNDYDQIIGNSLCNSVAKVKFGKRKDDPVRSWESFEILWCLTLSALGPHVLRQMCWLDNIAVTRWKVDGSSDAARLEMFDVSFVGGKTSRRDPLLGSQSFQPWGLLMSQCF